MSSDSENSTSDFLTEEVPAKISSNQKLMEILESYNIIFNKSQVPKIKEKKAQAYKEIHQKYILQIGRDLTEKQLKKKIQNMKTELKKKTDKTATGNKKIVLNAYEKQLLALMEGQENLVFQKVPGRTRKPCFSKSTRSTVDRICDGTTSAINVQN
ncbi:Myb/SANT-like DNA-binding domain [Popillia japonica]|uniref:Regulatory protein zeste n=1 Tax=Popillia japonica TaxID=7064 RepID=A0AAW1L8Y0_POPJA